MILYFIFLDAVQLNIVLSETKHKNQDMFPK